MNAASYWKTLQRRPLSRRRLLAGSAMSGAAVALAGSLSCSTARQSASGGSASKQAAPGQAVKQPRKGGVLNHPGGTAGSFDTLGLTFDPHIQGLSSAQSYTLFYERLLGYNPLTYKVEPEIAQKWEQISPTEYRFSLQPNVKWHNKPPASGRALTADDVLYSLQRVQTNDPKFVNRSLLASVEKIAAPDPSTITLTTKGPNAATLLTLSHDSLAMVAKEVFEKYPKPITADAAVGTGAFLVKSVEKDNPLRFTLNAVSKDHDQAAAQLLQAQWKRLSQGVVDTQIKLTDTATAQDIRASRSFTYGFYGLSPGMPDPDTWLTTSYRTGASGNFAGFSDPQVDAMIDKQRTIFDETQRKAAVKEIILSMIDHGVSTIPATRYFLNGVAAKVQGLPPEYYLNGRQYQSAWIAA